MILDEIPWGPAVEDHLIGEEGVLGRPIGWAMDNHRGQRSPDELSNRNPQTPCMPRGSHLQVSREHDRRPLHRYPLAHNLIA